MEIDKKKNELNEIYSDEMRIFLRQRHYEAGGRSVKLLAYKLKKQQAENTVFKIKDPKTNLVYNKFRDIHQSFQSF